MKEMTFTHDYAGSTSLHRVVYIEYHDGIPFDVITDEFDGYMHHFDFEPDCKGFEKLMFHNTGSGGKITAIQAPHIADGCTGVAYWMHPEAKFKGRPKNITRIEAPIEIDGHINPFELGRKIGGVEYCKFCDKWYDEDLCPEHHIITDEGDLQYFDGSPHE